MWARDAAARLGAGKAGAVAQGVLAAAVRAGVGRLALAVAAVVDVDPLDVLVAAEELCGLGGGKDDVARAHDVLDGDARGARLRGGHGARVLLAAHRLGDRARDLGVADRVRGRARELLLPELHPRRLDVPRAVEGDKLRRGDQHAAVAHPPLRVLLRRVQEGVHLERARGRRLCARRAGPCEPHSSELGCARAVDHLVRREGWMGTGAHTLACAVLQRDRVEWCCEREEGWVPEEGG